MDFVNRVANRLRPLRTESLRRTLLGGEQYWFVRDSLTGWDGAYPKKVSQSIQYCKILAHPLEDIHRIASAVMKI